MTNPKPLSPSQTTKPSTRQPEALNPRALDPSAQTPILSVVVYYKILGILGMCKIGGGVSPKPYRSANLDPKS